MQQGVIEEEVEKRGHEEWGEKKEGIRRKRLKGQKNLRGRRRERRNDSCGKG